MQFLFHKLKKILKFFQLYLRKSKILNEAGKLGEWYQPIKIAPFFNIYGIDKTGHTFSSFSSDRGIKKWRKFIYPSLPIDLKNKRVLEMGSNAGLFLFETVLKHGAKYGAGIDFLPSAIRQAEFIKKIYKNYFYKEPSIDFYQSKMEEFPIKNLEFFDICFFFQSIYHVGSRDPSLRKQTERKQIKLLNELSKKVEYFVFSANSLEDEGRGKGKKSLNDIIKKTNLKILYEKDYKHHRGYILVCKSKKKFIEKFDINKCVNKFFLPTNRSEEYLMVKNFISQKKFNLKDIKNTKYYLLKTNKIGWKFPGVSKLDKKYLKDYWTTPWVIKKRKIVSIKSDSFFINHYLKNFIRLFDLFKNEKRRSSIFNSSIPGYMLIHPKFGKKFVYTDGNKRISIMLFFKNKFKIKNLKINIKIINKIKRDDFLALPNTIRIIKSKFYTKKEALKFFDNIFA